MFDEIIQELEKLGKSHRVEIKVPLDEKGYYDRECPNSECGSRFKVLFEDWRDRVRDDQVFCPFCRHEAEATEWNTPEQVEHIKSAGLAEMSRLLNGAMQRGVQRSRPKKFGGGLIEMSMSLSFKPGSIPAVIVPQASEALRQDFTCETCGCRYASLGASFFCPACGHNSAVSCFETTLQTVERTVQALEPMRRTLADSVDPDTAHNAVRQLLEDQFARLIGAFERVNESLFDRLPNAAGFQKKGAVFQRIDDATTLWQQATGKGYDAILTRRELQRMKLLFQRRHLLSHRQGIIDQQYIDRSGDSSYAVGQRLVTKDADVLELVGLLRKFVDGLRTLGPPS
jgi:uncharacterized Zn finger protein (UPF0148 family)